MGIRSHSKATKIKRTTGTKFRIAGNIAPEVDIPSDELKLMNGKFCGSIKKIRSNFSGQLLSKTIPVKENKINDMANQITGFDLLLYSKNIIVRIRGRVIIRTDKKENARKNPAGIGFSSNVNFNPKRNKKNWMAERSGENVKLIPR